MKSHIVLRFVLGLALLCGLATGARARARVGLEAGLNEARATVSPGSFGLDPGYRPAWSGGVILDIPIRSRLSIEAGARYLGYDEKTTADFISKGGGASFWRHLRLGYLSVPVQLRVHTARGFFLGAGPEVGYLLSTWHEDGGTVAAPFSASRRAAQPTSTIIEDVGTFFSDPKGMYRPWNVSLSGGLGYEFPLHGHAAILEARYARGLTDVARSDQLDRQTRGYEALLGFLW
ncbi:MAG TPA: porin family protein [Terriglobales bacterium]|nr:porin family protein [Terriglobales bacterium]